MDEGMGERTDEGTDGLVSSGTPGFWICLDGPKIVPPWERFRCDGCIIMFFSLVLSGKALLEDENLQHRGSTEEVGKK